MNTRGIAAVAVIVVLAIAIFAAVYFSRKNGNSNNGINVSEFTGRGTSTLGYTSVVYSKLTLNGDTPTAWNLEAQVDYTDSGVAFRDVYTNGRIYHGQIESNGFFNISSCSSIDQSRTLTDPDGQYRFVPIEVSDDRPAPLSLCPTCKQWSLAVKGQNYIMEEQDGNPKFFYSRDQTITVSEFTYGARTWTAPAIDSSYDSLCQGEDSTTGSNKLGKLFARQQARDSVFNTEHADVPVNKDWKVDAQQFNQKVRKQEKIVMSHPMQLQGVCVQSKRGDGYCDADCNNLANNYDNGDCCPGTCTTGRTYPCGSRAAFSCVRPGKECLFLHGVGNSGPNRAQSSPLANGCSLGRCSYWGDMPAQLQGICSTYTYMNADTTGYGWNSAFLQNLFYSEAQRVSGGGGYVYAHSMGNMIMGGACMYQGKCGVRWYDLGGPIRGSAVGSVASVLQSIFGNVLGAAYNSLATSVEGLGSARSRQNGLVTTIQNNNLVRGAACGTAGFGSGGLAGTALSAAKGIVYGWWECSRSVFGICYSWRNVPADGVVHADECGRWGSWSGSFNTGFQNRFFLHDGNHYDLTGTAGNYNNIYDWYRYASLNL